MLVYVLHVGTAHSQQRAKRSNLRWTEGSQREQGAYRQNCESYDLQYRWNQGPGRTGSSVQFRGDGILEAVEVDVLWRSNSRMDRGGNTVTMLTYRREAWA